jgi:chromate reductase
VKLRVAAMCGSLRKGSYNQSLLDEFIRRSADVFDVTQVSIGDLPHFNQDLERSAPPEVASAKAIVQAADCLLLVSPEHDYTLPAVLKNAVEWLSRPHGDPTLTGRPMALMGASTGRMGTVRAQIAWRASWHFFKAPVFSGVEVMISDAASVFGGDRGVADVGTSVLLDTYIAQLAEWLEARRRV